MSKDTVVFSVKKIIWNRETLCDAGLSHAKVSNQNNFVNAARRIVRKSAFSQKNIASVITLGHNCLLTPPYCYQRNCQRRDVTLLSKRKIKKMTPSGKRKQ